MLSIKDLTITCSILIVTGAEFNDAYQISEFNQLFTFLTEEAS